MRSGGFLLALAFGGAVGTLARYGLGGWVQRSAAGTFPFGTLVVNLVGCLAIGCVAAYADRGGLLSASGRIVLQIGVIGGFTTFSSFGLETLRLVADGDWLRAGAYVALTNVGGLAAVWLGYRAIEFLRV